jgi:hypothetical protein
MAHVESPPGYLPDHGKGLYEKIFQRGSLLELFLEF